MTPRTASDVKQVKRLLSGRGVTRDDSDDELGDEDLTWEWIYDGERANQITGAKFGDFRCMLGDCVLLKAEGAKEAWVAIVCEFFEDEGGRKEANFMWFSTEREVRNKAKKRIDALKVRSQRLQLWRWSLLTNQRTNCISRHPLMSTLYSL